MMLGHESSNSSNRTVLPQTDNFSISLNPVVLQGLELDSLVRPLDLLWLGVNLLLTLLTATTETQYQVKSGLLLDVVVGEGTSVLELLSGEDKTLLIRWDSLLILDFGFDVVDCVRWLYIKRNGFAYFVEMTYT